MIRLGEQDGSEVAVVGGAAGGLLVQYLKVSVTC
jgi:hypothetical protein